MELKIWAVAYFVYCMERDRKLTNNKKCCTRWPIYLLPAHCFLIYSYYIFVQPEVAPFDSLQYQLVVIHAIHRWSWRLINSDLCVADVLWNRKARDAILRSLTQLITYATPISQKNHYTAPRNDACFFPRSVVRYQPSSWNHHLLNHHSSSSSE